MSSGVNINCGVTRKCIVKRVDDFTFKIILTQGLNRQIRKMCDKCSLDVLELRRVSIGEIKLGELQTGKWRMLDRAQTDKLKGVK